MDDDAEAERTLYVHLRFDGTIFFVRGDSGEEGYMTGPNLASFLAELKGVGGSVMYTREHPETDPPAVVTNTFRIIAEAGLPIQMLPEAHPNANRAPYDGATMLMAAAYEGKADWVEDLLERGADPEAKDGDGETAIMYACNHKQVDSVRALIQGGADVNAPDNQRSTPLMFAAQHGNMEIVRLLLEGGADPAATGDHGYNAAGLAQANGHEEVLSFLT